MRLPIRTGILGLNRTICTLTGLDMWGYSLSEQKLERTLECGAVWWVLAGVRPLPGLGFFDQQTTVGQRGFCALWPVRDSYSSNPQNSGPDRVATGWDTLRLKSGRSIVRLGRSEAAPACSEPCFRPKA
jgi:hypothetical protein